MKILNNIKYDHKKTLEYRAALKDEVPLKKLNKLCIYNITDEYDLLEKFCFASSYQRAVYVYLKKQIKRLFFKFFCQ